MKSARYTQTIPFGWFAVEYSNQLAIGEVKPLYYFDRDLVIYRTESGAVHVLDAFCPHLGAHIGHGGQVHGEYVACPFHGWQFDAAGVCQSVPYANNMPPRARDKQLLNSYPTLEKNQMIWVWYHPHGIAPDFELDEVPEFDSPDYTEMEIYDWEVNTIIQ